MDYKDIKFNLPLQPEKTKKEVNVRANFKMHESYRYEDAVFSSKS